MGSVTVVITLLLLLLTFFDHPHGGGLGKLQPTAMQRNLRLMDERADVDQARPVTPVRRAGPTRADAFTRCTPVTCTDGPSIEAQVPDLSGSRPCRPDARHAPHRTLETIDMNVTASFGNGDVLLWMLEFFLFVIWFWLLISIFSDLFRDRSTGGGVKALWVFFLIILPFLGILLYLIFRGKGMGERSVRRRPRRSRSSSTPRSARRPATAASPADQIAKAKALLDSGAIDQAEFDKLKAAALA